MLQKQLAQLLHQISLSAHRVAPVIEALRSSDPEDETALNYSTLLSQLEDARELIENEGVGAPSKGRCPVNLANVAQNFSEGFAHRFGPKRASQLLILVHQHVPVVSTYPAEFIKLFDGVVRGFFQLAPSASLEIEVQRHPGIKSAPDRAAITFSFISSAVTKLAGKISFGEISPSALFADTDVSPLNIELLAALQLATRLGGRCALVSSLDGHAALEILFDFAAPAGHSPAPQTPEDFYYCTDSTEVAAALDKLARFHRINASRVASATEVPPFKKLIFDAQHPSARAAAQKLPRPGDTVVLLPVNDLKTITHLASMRFEQFIDFPLVSTRVVRALGGFDPFRPSTPSPTAPIERRLRVLLVDDTMTARAIARDYLEAQGHWVTEANDGMELVRLLEQGRKFDLIFCDLMMTHLDGVSALKQIRAAGNKTPAVLVTTYTEIAAEERAFEAGFDRVLRKPLAPAQVELMIEELVRGHKPSRPPRPTQIINLDDLRGRCRGKTRTMVQILGAFIDESSQSYQELCKQAINTDRGQTKKLVHKIKGLFRDAGADSAAETMIAIEQQLEKPDYAISSDLERIDQLIRNVQRSAHELQDELTP